MNKLTDNNTEIIHHPYSAPDGFKAFPVGIHHASTVVFENVAAMRANGWLSKASYTYGLHGTPTSFTLEERLASIEQGKHCLLAPSGLAAIALVNLAFLKSGDDVLIPDNAYNPNREMGQWLASHFGISARYYDPMIGAGLQNLMLPNTKLVWVEAPGSISMEVPDVPALCAAARAHGALTVIDNTWSAGIAFAAFEHGVDIIMQALTKYQCGGSDVLMGAVITRDQSIHSTLQMTHMRLGYGVGMDDVYLVLRSLPSLRLRFDAHDQSARRVATWLQSRSEITRVLHPALPSCPGHETWKRDFTGAGGLFSVLFDEKYSSQQVDRFVDSLKLFKIGYSWGGANSLCVPYHIEKIRQQWDQNGILVRFNIGLEDTQDLIADIEQALTAMHASQT